jgi:hypothetical protein
MNDFEQDTAPQSGINPYKVTAGLSGLIGITSLTTFGFVSATMLPGLLAPVGWLSAIAILGSVGYGFLSLTQRNAPQVVMAAGAAIAVLLGTVLGIKEIFLGWMLSLQFGAVSGGGVLLLFLLCGIVVGVHTLLGGLKRD